MLPSELPDVPVVALDTETSGLHPDPPENGRVAVVSLAWATEEGGRATTAFPFDQGVRDKKPQGTLALYDDPNLPKWEWDALLKWLQRRWLVMHGAKFDLTMMWAGLRFAPGINLAENLLWDTMLAARDLDATDGAELADVERRMDFFETQEARDRWLATKKKRSNLDLVEWAEVEEYASADATITYAGYEHQVARYEAGEGDRGALERKIAMTRVLFGIEQRGIGYDAARSLEMAKKIKAWEHTIAKSMPFLGGIEKARKWFFSNTGGRALALHFTAGGKPKLDEEAVQLLVVQRIPHAVEYAQARRLETARTKWYESYAEHTGEDGRLRTVFSQGEVVSGRMSSTRVNLQAIPQNYQLVDIAGAGLDTPRQLFRPRKGSKLWELDLSQAELRIAAKLAGCQPMIDLIKAKEDVHGATARRLFDDEPGTKTWPAHRDVSKRANFALIFDAGEEEFYTKITQRAVRQARRGKELVVDEFGLTQSETFAVVRMWKQMYPEYKRAIKEYDSKIRNGGYIRLVNGRVRWFSKYEDSHKAFNQMVQGSLAEFMETWMIAVDKVYPGVIVLTIHDSLVLDTPKKSIVINIRSMGAKMATRMFGIPMEIDLKEWKVAA